MPYLRMCITLREAPKVAEALDEYKANHKELPALYGLRFGQLAKELRDATERGLQKEAEAEERRWGKR